MHLGEALNFSLHALGRNPVSSFLTGLGMVVGTASVTLVVTISLASNFTLEQIVGVDSSMIFAKYEVAVSSGGDANFINVSDVQAIRNQLAPQIVAASGIESDYDSTFIDGREERLLVIGSDEFYRPVRNLVVLSGRFLDASDIDLGQKVALMTEKLAERMYTSVDNAVGQTIKIHTLQFRVIGTFKEKVDSYGQSELNDETLLIPITVQQSFIPIKRIDPLYVRAGALDHVHAVTTEVREILESRHPAAGSYRVDNLTSTLNASKSIFSILELVLTLVSAIALVTSGIGITNIMLVSVTEHTREICVRMAVGASRQDILKQFLTEAMLISLASGIIGILIGVALLQIAADLFENINSVSMLSIIVALTVSSLVGLVFGILPASHAARLSPTGVLRCE